MLTIAQRLMRKARAGIVPGAKMGRRWVFIQDDLLAYFRERALGTGLPIYREAAAELERLVRIETLIWRMRQADMFGDRAAWMDAWSQVPSLLVGPSENESETP